MICDIRDWKKIIFLIYQINYYQKNKEKLKDKYYNQGGKERAKEYYQANKDVIKEKARIRYQNFLLLVDI